MVKDFCAFVGIEGKTNHSLRATNATRLFEPNNVPEKLIQEVTGHRLCVYEHRFASQYLVVSTIMCAQTSQSYQAAGTSTPKKPVKQALKESSLPNTFKNCTNCIINVNFSS